MQLPSLLTTFCFTLIDLFQSYSTFSKVLFCFALITKAHKYNPFCFFQLEKGVTRMRLKLADFGGAFRRQSVEEYFNDEQNKRWTAPEIWWYDGYGKFVLKIPCYAVYRKYEFFIL